MLLRLANKAFRPARFPFPLLHIDTGHNFPEVIAFRDVRAAELGERLIVRSVEDSIASGRVVLRRRTTSPQRAPERDAARRHRGVRFDALHRRRAPRRGKGARQRARVQLPRRVRASGTRRTSGRSCGTCTTRACTRASTCACFRSATGPSSTCGSTSRASGSRCRRSTSRTYAPVVRRNGGLLPVTDLTPPRAGEVVEQSAVRFRTVGDIPCTARWSRPRPTAHAIILETAAATHHRARRHAPGRPDIEASMELRKKAGYF